MKVMDEKNLLILELIRICSLYFFTVIVMCISVYVVIILVLKMFKQKSLQDSILEKLCKTVMQNELANCLTILEEHPDYINSFTKNGYTPFLLACGCGNTQMVKIMLRKGADIKLKSWNHESPFYLACFYYIKNPRLKNASCIRELFYAGADINEPNDKGLNPLQMAAMFGHSSLVKWLLCKNSSTNLIPHPLLIAVAQGHKETVDVLLNHGCSLAITCK